MSETARIDAQRTARDVAFAASMKAENEELLRLLGYTEEDDVFDETTPDVSFDEPVSKDLEIDAFGDFHSGGSGTLARVTPAPPAQTNTAVASNAVVNIPVQPARLAEPASTHTPVAAAKSIADASFANFTSIIRSANSNARGSGNKVASVVVALGEDGSSVVTADIHSWLFRICQALFAAELGASAAPLPNGPPFQVVETTLALLGTAIDNNPDAVPVYLPRELSFACKAAALSLLVHGGAGAYTWRYRGGQQDRELVMPAVTRWMPPGGFNTLLAVVDDWGLPQVGGQSLTLAALRGLEVFYRRRYGNDLMDSAWRTVSGLAHVYVAPLPAVDPPLLPTGENCQWYNVTRVMRAPDVAVNLGALDDNVVQVLPPDPGGVLQRMRPLRAVDVVRWGQQFEALLQAIFRVAFSGLDGRGSETLGRVEQILPDPDGVQFSFRSQDEDGTWLDGEQERLGWEMVVAQRDAVPERDRGAFRTMMALARGVTFFNDVVAEFPGDDQGDPLDPDTHQRNVYGANDNTSVYLPYLDINAAVGVVSHYLRPTRLFRKQRVLSQQLLRSWTRTFAARLHLANFFALVKRGIFPQDLTLGSIAHADVMKFVHYELLSPFLMATIDDASYATQNWHVLESPYLLRRVNNKTPFIGFNVPGEWDVNASGRIRAWKKTNSFVALDAAMRSAVNGGMAVDALGQFAAGTHFGLIRGVTGLVHPLVFSPRIRGTRAYDTVTLSPAGGNSPLLGGSNSADFFLTLL